MANRSVLAVVMPAMPPPAQRTLPLGSSAHRPLTRAAIREGPGSQNGGPLASAHVPALHTPVTHSAGELHESPGQPRHEPPQSTSVSSPLRTASKHDAPAPSGAVANPTCPHAA